jgi:SAM-dependent methyltransferase
MWKIKVLIQFFLSHMPFGEAINHRLQRVNAIRRGGATSLRNRINEVDGGLRNLQRVKPLAGSVVVEVGTGWDALPTLLLRKLGAERIYTFDHVAHLRHDLAQSVGREIGLPDPEQLTLAGLLESNGIDYVAPGDATKTGLPDKSVDLFYSFAVLEHVPDNVAAALMAEARRVLKPGGIWYSLIGLHDHYAGFDKSVSEVNFLRYPEWLWRLLVKNNISYHNRLRERDFLDMMARAGGEIVRVHHVQRPEDVERVKAMKVDRRFAGYTPEELAVTRTEIIARFA